MKIKKVIASVVIVAGLGAGALVAAVAAVPADVGPQEGPPNHFDTNRGGGFDDQVYTTDDSPKSIGLDPGIYTPPAQGLNYGNGATATMPGEAGSGQYVQPGRSDDVAATAGHQRAATQ